MTSENPIRFADLGLAAEVLEALDGVGYEHPTPIQAQSIPPLLEGRDLLGTAQTGTGKTAAFALPLLTRLDAKSRAPQVLVLTPTRELAIQVAEAFQSYAARMPGFHVLPIYGGQSMGIQLRQLKRGAQVVVGTPGRVMDHLRRGTLGLGGLRSVVLDEADEMLRMGFIEDVQWILEHTPSTRQIALFSATMPAAIRRVADAHLTDPARISIASRTSTVEHVEQRFWIVAGTSKLDALTRMLDAADHDGVIVFVRTKISSENLADRLEARGHAAAAINGDMTQAQREATIARLKSGAIDILVATDVAARGIDVARIGLVVNYDVPHDTEAYVHRIGRTGRAGRSGRAILFVAPRERRMLAAIERATGQKMTPMELPSRAEIDRVRTARFKDELTTVLAEVPLQRAGALVQEYLAEHEVDVHQLAAALAWMAQRDAGTARRDAPAAEPPRPPRREPTPRPERREPRKASTDGSGGRARTDEDAPELELFHLSVGHDHGVQPGDIVGAIANEAELDSRYIGRIRLFDDHSTVELPTGMPRELMQLLRRVRVRNVPLRLRRASDPEDAGDDVPPPRDTARGPRPPARRKQTGPRKSRPSGRPPARGRTKRDR